MSKVNPNIIDSIIRRQTGEVLPSDYFTSRIFKNRLGISRNLYKKDLLNHYGCVNAIEFSEDGNWLVSGEFMRVQVMVKSQNLDQTNNT